MANPSGRDIVERFVRALGTDPEAIPELIDPDFVEEWPQSGERVRGWDNLRKVMEGYPGAEAGGSVGTSELRGVAGYGDTWVTTPGPTFAPVQILGTGDVYTSESKGHYPDGSEWFVLHIVKLRNGKVFRVTTYFAAPFEAPEWRAPFVERME